MKNSLVHPIMFLFILILMMLLLTALYLLNDVIMSYPNLKVLSIDFRNLPVIISEILPTACLFSMILLFFRMVKKPGSRILSFLLVFIVAGGSLAAGLITFNYLTEKVAAKELPLTQYLPEKKIYTNNKQILYLEKLDNQALRDIVQIIPDAPAKERLRYYPQGTVRKEENKLMLNLEQTDREIKTLSLNAQPLQASLLEPHWSLNLFINDFALLTRELRNFQKQHLNAFLILCFALTFSTLSCQVFLKITRWPLFNLLLLIVLSRGLLFLYNLLRFEIITKLLKLDTGSFFIRILPSLVLIGLGILFLIIDILFIPANFWQKEIEGE